MATIIGFGRRRLRRDAAPPRSRRGVERLGEILSLGVIPRMLIAHTKPVDTPEDQHPLIRASDVEALVPAAVNEPAHMLLEHVEAIMRRGVSVEEIFVDLLAPVARLVGREWEEDRLDFIQVSMALWRLQEVLRQIAANTTRAEESDASFSALFAPMPGDQHSFGTTMVHECFAIAGWDAELLVEASLQQLIETVAQQRYDLLGLTVSCDCNNDRLASLIRAVRSVSKNPHLCIMIGGRLPEAQPNLVALSGADGTAASAPAAVKTAERLVGMMRMAATA
jgi:MerR family transcriptional regulator, light-induced transcriptional regulator